MTENLHFLRHRVYGVHESHFSGLVEISPGVCDVGALSTSSLVKKLNINAALVFWLSQVLSGLSIIVDGALGKPQSYLFRGVLFA